MPLSNLRRLYKRFRPVAQDQSRAASGDSPSCVRKPALRLQQRIGAGIGIGSIATAFSIPIPMTTPKKKPDLGIPYRMGFQEDETFMKLTHLINQVKTPDVLRAGKD
jgi:hypothetical protein